MNKKIVSIVIISALVITMGAISVFAAEYPTASYNEKTWAVKVLGMSGNPQVGTFSISTDSYTPYYLNSDRTNNNTYQYNTFDATIEQQYHIVLKLFNSTDQYLCLNSSSLYFRTSSNSTIPSSAGYQIETGWRMGESNNDNLFMVQNFASYPTFRVYLYELRGDDGKYYIPPYQTYVIEFDLFRVTHYWSTVYNTTQPLTDYDTSIPLNNLQISYNGTTMTTGTEFWMDNPMKDYVGMTLEYWNIYQLDQNVKSILDQYTANSQNAQQVIDGTDNYEQGLSTIGINEDTWFSQNNQALQATGLGDFSFDIVMTQGFGVISGQFNKLWNAIGYRFQSVFTFSMMLSLVMLILRHNPQRRKSSGSSGSGGGKSNATSS